jgi:hypothetical protein
VALLELRDGFGQISRQELVEQLVHGKRWIVQTLALVTHCGTNTARIEVKETTHEFVRMLGLDPIWSESFFRKVFEVVGDDHFGIAADCGRKDVAVVGVWQG